MNSKKFLIAIIVVAVLVFAGWIVSERTKGLDMPSFKPFPASNVAPSAPTQESPNANANPVPSDLPVLADHMPEFSGIAAWLNSKPLAQADLRGKVVLVDFWTYSCINCIRTLPYTTSWYGKYKDKGLVVIGVHTPEFAFEKVQSNVQAALKQYGIEYPVALDNDYGTWNGYSNEYWPAEYLFDARGRLRHTHFGEGEYDQTEKDIQGLLAELGEKADMPTDAVVTPDFQKIGSPETYLGYNRQQYLGSPETVKRDGPQTYSAAATPELNRFYLVGAWRVEGERAVPLNVGDKIVYRYSASNANLVMGGTGGAPVRATILLDGKPVPDGFRGKDIQVGKDGATYVNVDEQRLYDLTDSRATYGEHTMEIIFGGTNIAAYAFTFG